MSPGRTFPATEPRRSMRGVAGLAGVALAALACATRVVAQPVGARSSIVGTVFDSLRSHAPLANATVVLVEQSRYVTTDARGRFRMDGVAEGRYTLGFVHPVLDSLDLQVPVTQVDVAAGRRSAVTLFTPSPTTAYARLCPGPRDVETGVIVGLVRDVDERTPLADVVVSTEWTEFTVAKGRSVGKRVSTKAHTGADGLYLLCNVPVDTPIELRSDFAGFVAGPVRVVVDTLLISRTDFAISRTDSSARHLLPAVALSDSSTVSADTTVAPSPVGTASLRGRILLANGKAATNAIVAVAGTARSVRTDSVGAFLLAGIPAGTRTIEVRGIGSLPFETRFDFATRDVRAATVHLVRAAQELAPVDVRGVGEVLSFMKASGFDDRRRMGLGAFLTDSAIAKHVYTDLLSVLGAVRGLRIDVGTTGFPMPLMLRANGLCIPAFFLDGAYFPVDGPTADEKVKYPFTDLNGLVRANQIKGIEVYSGLGAVPLQFDRSFVGSCGAVVIWTH